MSDEVRVVYGFCQDNCKHPVYTKEDVIGLLKYVIENNALPSDIVDGNYDSTQGLVAVNSVVEQNKGKAINFFVGTQAEYDAYAGDKTNLFAVISDDTTKQSIIDTLSQHTKSINGIIDGSISVGKVNGVEITKDENGVLRVGDTIIPQKKLLYEYNGRNDTVSLPSPVSPYDVFEILFNSPLGGTLIRKFVCYSSSCLGVVSELIGYGSNGTTDNTDTLNVVYGRIDIVNGNELQMNDVSLTYITDNTENGEIGSVQLMTVNSLGTTMRIQKVWKVIE